MKKSPKESILKNTVKIKTALQNSNMETMQFIREKTLYFQEIMKRTILSIQNYKKHDIFSNSDISLCLQNINDLYDKSNEIIERVVSANFDEGSPDLKDYTENLITLLQHIIDKLSVIICGFGTSSFDDLLYVCIGSQYKNIVYETTELQNKIELIRKYIHPIGYKTIHGKPEKSEYMLCSNKIVEDITHMERSPNYECYDIESTQQTKTNFYSKIYGMRVVLQDESSQKAIVVTGIIDDIVVKCVTGPYIIKRRKDILNNLPDDSLIDKIILERFIDMMSLKDFLIWGNEDIYKKYWLVVKDVSIVKQNKTDSLIKRFVEMDVFSQRTMLLNLLAYDIDDEIRYITYMLYDVITANNVGSNVANQNYVVGETLNTRDQILIYDSFPWPAKMQFKDVMKFTVKYTQDMINKYDINRVSIEQQIYLMKVPEYIKEKAIVKLKEIKGKGDDTSSKAKQYLEGLLKIPFGVYREEPILKRVKTNNAKFIQLLLKQTMPVITMKIPKKSRYTNIELLKYTSAISGELAKQMDAFLLNTLHIKVGTNNTVEYSPLNSTETKIVANISKYIQDYIAIETTGGREPAGISFVFTKKKKEIREQIYRFLNTYPKYKPKIYNHITQNRGSPLSKNNSEIIEIQNEIANTEKDMNTITEVLNESIHGHDYAKNQILKIIGQWMNGEQTGYCFGFEGSPGVGKTSVAKKGLAKCLIDENGQSRPFAFIALGGSCNGSTLEGHSYTYVNSIWGRITDILMESKCMNPIIYVDELDKVSKTEHGKEIIGILTHLIDTTQNDCFQDKYYSGINLDLSKALFIFSYNDPDNIDRILLDRIHRVRFDNLTIDDKMIIVKDYILKEINEKMGFSDTVQLTDEIIEYIIETYTLEPGVRKLKEVLFDLFGEINLELLRCTNENIIIPLNITIDDLDSKYLKKYHKVQETKIPAKSAIGIINGLWANALGKGGIIPIETMFFPSSSFLELRLTGLQGDVMKESMNVAKSLAWKLTPGEKKKSLVKIFEETKCQGLHIHCPQGAVSKDGPSAGTAITVAIYSLLNNLVISNTVAITGEINLQGQVTAIGGLDAKILGGIRAGVKTFLYPESNHRDYEEFMEKYAEKAFLEGIQFIEISSIEQVIAYIFEGK
jgi:Lon protease (S16) C-terminal proteolytic domain/ATPase family associated with various cellular activities (AAA)